MNMSHAALIAEACSYPYPPTRLVPRLADALESALSQIREYEDAICWDTTCLNCSKLLDDKPDVKNSVDNLVTLFQDYRRKLGHNTFAIAYSKGYHGHGH